MAQDTRNFIDQMQSRVRAYQGRDLSTDELATEFAKWDIGDRVNYLQSIDADEAAATYSSTQEAADQHVIHSALRNMHEKLRKVDR